MLNDDWLPDAKNFFNLGIWHRATIIFFFYTTTLRQRLALNHEGVHYCADFNATDRAAVSLLFSLLVVKRFVPFVLRLPGVLQDGAEDGLEQQDCQVDDKKCIHRPVEGMQKDNVCAHSGTLQQKNKK